MDTSAYSNRDAKIIRENEGKAPYDLLALGLSQKGFDRLTAQLETERRAPVPKSAQRADKVEEVKTPADGKSVTPDKVEDVVTSLVSPKQTKAVDRPIPAYAVNDTVMLVGPTGIPKQIARGAAIRLVKSNPQAYKIL